MKVILNKMYLLSKCHNSIRNMSFKTKIDYQVLKRMFKTNKSIKLNNIALIMKHLDIKDFNKIFILKEEEEQMNSLNIIGRITATPELKVSNNTKYTRFSVAVKRIFAKDTTDFFNCTAFGKTAEIICEYVKKGQQIGVTGRIEFNTKDGKTYHSVQVEQVEFLGSSSDKDVDLSENKPASKQASKPAAKPQPTYDDDDDEFPF